MTLLLLSKIKSSSAKDLLEMDFLPSGEEDIKSEMSCSQELRY